MHESGVGGKSGDGRETVGQNAPDYPDPPLQLSHGAGLPPLGATLYSVPRKATPFNAGQGSRRDLSESSRGGSRRVAQHSEPGAECDSVSLSESFGGRSALARPGRAGDTAQAYSRRA